MTDRRQILQTASAVAALAALPVLGASATPTRPIKAIAFDGFTVFDPRPAAVLAESLFPGMGAALVATWRTRLFEYQWLRTLSGRYAGFVETAEASLVFAAKMHRLELTPDKRSLLIRAQTRLEPWPRAREALDAMRSAGLRLALCSNMSTGMLEDGLARAGLAPFFEHVLSSDRARAHKPDPRAYRMPLDAFGLAREEVLFAAFASWDVAGAAWFGYPTYWVNPAAALAEELEATPESTGASIADLARHSLARASF